MKKKELKKEPLNTNIIEEKIIKKISKKELNQKIKYSKKLMENAAKSLNFTDAILHRDNLIILKKELKNRKL